MTQPRVFIVSGPSGVGKSSIIHGVLDRREDVRLSVSTTTRETREEEEEGRDYYFVDKAEFERTIARDWFLEWARSYGNYYGTGRTQIEDILSQGCHALLDIDTQGALNIQKRFSGAVYIFIAPPSLSVLEERLRGRGSETPESLKRRLKRAGAEIELSHSYDHVIVNTTIEAGGSGFLASLEKEAARKVDFGRMENSGYGGEHAHGGGAWGVVLCGGLSKTDRVGPGRNRACRRMVKLDAQAARVDRGVGEELFQIVDRPPGNPRGIQGSLKRPTVQRGNGFGDGGDQGGAILDTGAVVGVGGIGGQVGAADDVAEARELAIIANRDDDMAVGGGECLIGHDVRMRVAQAPRRISRGQIIHRLIGEHRHLAVEQRHIDILAAAAALAMDQGGKHGGDHIHAGE